MTDAATMAWTALLDRFERDLARPDGTDEPWHTTDEPLPAALRGRAAEVLRQQRERLSRTRDELDRVREQLDALQQVPATRVDAPVYLDIDA